MNIKQLVMEEKTFLFLLFSVALLIRLIYVIPLSPEKLSPDAFDWMSIAENVASGNGYVDTFRPPGYATFLGIIFFLFGKSILIVRIINSALGASTCVIIYFVGKKVFSSAVGKISAFLLCFYPYLIAYTGDLLSETFYTFLISFSVLTILNCSENINHKNIFLTGFTLGITALTKSTILPFFFLACIWLWWRTKNIKTGFLVGVCILITIAPWTVRNYLRYNQFVLVSPGYIILWLSNNDEALVVETIGEKKQPATDNWDWTPKRYVKYSKLPRMESEKIFKDEAINWIKNNPEKFKWLVKRRLVHFWRLYPMMAYKWQKIAAMVTSGIYIPLCFIGIILSIKRFQKTSLLILFFIIYTLVHLLFMFTLRHRIPIDPYIIIFASFTIHFIWTKLKSFISSRV